MRAIPERLRGVFTTRRYKNPRLPLPLQRQVNVVTLNILFLNVNRLYIYYRITHK